MQRNTSTISFRYFSAVGQLLPCGDSSMPPPAVSVAAARSVFRRFRRNRRGSAAVEFALVAPVFFALLFAIIETAIVFFASQVLETITQNSARQVMTGQAQGANYAKWNNFRDGVVCAQIPALFTCANVFVDVESDPSSFANVTLKNHIDVNGNFDPSTLGYNPGGACSIVVVQLFYQWPLYVTGLGYNITNLGNKRNLVATAAFRSEPYNGACPS
jgi:Flp pilus assembly protein TadG